MSKQRSLQPLAIAVGAALAAGVLTTPSINAEENPFGLTTLSTGYMVAAKGEGKCGEGKCGEGKEDKQGEGKCGEGKCGK